MDVSADEDFVSSEKYGTAGDVDSGLLKRQTIAEGFPYRALD